MKLLRPHADRLYAVFRIVAGFLFSFHGAQKLFGAFGGAQAHSAKMLLAGGIEFLGGILVMAGLFASIAAFLASGEMAFAYFMSHASKALWPIENKGELAALYCFVFLYIAARGSGPFSLDRLRRRA